MLRCRASWLLVLLAGACAWEPGNPPRYEMDEHACEELTAAHAERQYVGAATSSEQSWLAEGAVQTLVFAAEISGAATLLIEPSAAGIYGFLTTHALSWNVWNEEDGFVPPHVVDVVGCDAVVQATWFELHPELYQVYVAGAPAELHVLTVVLAEPASESEDEHGH